MCVCASVSLFDNGYGVLRRTERSRARISLLNGTIKLFFNDGGCT